MDVTITKRVRRRKSSGGKILENERYVVNYRDPKTGQRKQKFYDKQKDAVAKKNEVLVELKLGTYVDEKTVPTVREAVENWLKDREGEIKHRTWLGYKAHGDLIIGPLLKGDSKERYRYSLTGKIPDKAEFIELLGDYKITDLTTADIRTWYKIIQKEVGAYSATKTKQTLGTVLAIAGEDYNLRPPVLPRRIGKGRKKTKRAILLPDQVSKLLREARKDKDRGLYYAFPFLAGTRPSEQLGLLWQDIDFEKNLIHICRMQEMNDGKITNITKTDAGNRFIPMSKMLREWLLEWKIACPRKNGKLHRVFPSLGYKPAFPKPRFGGGGPLLYANFRKRFWRKGLEKAGVPVVTPHSARHCFISTLQAEGIEVALVAQLAGHSSPAVTLGYYTHAVRGGEDAVEKLAQAFNS